VNKSLISKIIYYTTVEFLNKNTYILNCWTRLHQSNGL